MSMAFEKSFYSSSKRGSNSRVFLANTFLHTWLCMLNNIVDIVNVVGMSCERARMCLASFIVSDSAFPS